MICAAGFAGNLMSGADHVSGGDKESIPGPIAASVVEVTDGDTLVVRAYIWLDHEVETRVRLDGIDTPELKGGCEKEKRLARLSRDFVISWVKDRKIVLTDIKYDKYARRVIARVKTPAGEDLGQALIAAANARPYAGGKRQPWC
ncbi:MAG: hypothetical protein A3G18_05810 [Rhodospirillales bacterium RIFCSPLOWO2_12_FULL_58_28]|nr:MAG: hypothetical protein A3H92_00115 [Rhodospirillales bacterium RIFCSPLOWO2_02_FULL_58_16]OHC79302.1 MAG: hypothetical protein A3G18_05810 [Rhodospirillales bacterium RIFCSPLOWO2_12_FULL_58_28]